MGIIKITRYTLVAFCLLTIPAIPLSAQEVVEDAEVKAQIGLFSAWLEGQLEIRGLPGVVVGVVSDQELVWAKGFGHADIEADQPMQPDTRFRMASHSKLFTATAIMQLREENKLRLDDPVTEYLPWFNFQQASPDDPSGTPISGYAAGSGFPLE